MRILFTGKYELTGVKNAKQEEQASFFAPNQGGH